MNVMTVEQSMANDRGKDGRSVDGGQVNLICFEPILFRLEN